MTLSPPRGSRADGFGQRFVASACVGAGAGVDVGVGAFECVHACTKRKDAALTALRLSLCVQLSSSFEHRPTVHEVLVVDARRDQVAFSEITLNILYLMQMFELAPETKADDLHSHKAGLYMPEVSHLFAFASIAIRVRQTFLFVWCFTEGLIEVVCVRVCACVCCNCTCKRGQKTRASTRQ